jgi:acyl-CoA reductase-like NAD-dependent aldehyde dehydrogenase
MIGKLGEKIELKRNSIAELITKEMGKPITESQG